LSDHSAFLSSCMRLKASSSNTPMGLSGVPYASLRISSVSSPGRSHQKHAPFFGRVFGFRGDLTAVVGRLDLRVDIVSSEDIVDFVGGWRPESTWRMLMLEGLVDGSIRSDCDMLECFVGCLEFRWMSKGLIDGGRLG